MKTLLLALLVLVGCSVYGQEEIVPVAKINLVQVPAYVVNPQWVNERVKYTAYAKLSWNAAGDMNKYRVKFKNGVQVGNQRHFDRAEKIYTQYSKLADEAMKNITRIENEYVDKEEIWVSAEWWDNFGKRVYLWPGGN